MKQYKKGLVPHLFAKQQGAGFTLIELLVVIAIIGILSTLAVVSLGNARTRARDSKRVADIRNVQTALEIYYTDRVAYPAAPAANVCTASDTTLEGCCLENAASSGGWLATCTAANRLITVPKDPRDLAADDYVYSIVGTNYNITFVLESGAGDLTGSGTKCASPAGISNTATCL